MKFLQVQIQTLRCTVCQQITADYDEQQRTAFEGKLYGWAAWTQCPCCLREVPGGDKDAAYKRRFVRWVLKNRRAEVEKLFTERYGH